MGQNTGVPCPGMVSKADHARMIRSQSLKHIERLRLAGDQFRAWIEFVGKQVARIAMGVID